MKVAIVHEWFVNYAGSESVVEKLLDLFPNADLFSLIDFSKEADKKRIHHKKVTTSFIQQLPFARKIYRNYLFLMPLAIEQLDVSDYDVVISSSHAVAKGVLTHAQQLHICYCHSPMRYAWDLYHHYLAEAQLKGLKAIFAKLILHRMRLWDYSTANRVDYFIANSDYIARRIHKIYRRKAEVIYPPVEVNQFTVGTHKEDFYLTASRMVPYKKIDLIVEAFSEMPTKKLVVIGDGPDFKKIKEKAGANILFLGFQSNDALKDYMQRAKAFVFAAEEDFGITPVEAQACGTPVVAYGKGGVLETVTAETGVFFYSQDKASLKEAVHIFEQKSESFNTTCIRKRAEQFSAERFSKQIYEFILSKYQEYNK